MLVLTRRIGEKVRIDTEAGVIRFQICKVKGGSIRVGIEAPKEYPIRRDETVTEEKSIMQVAVEVAAKDESVVTPESNEE